MSDDIPSPIRCGTVIELDLRQAKCRVADGNSNSEEGDAETGRINWLAPRAGSTHVWNPLGLTVLLFNAVGAP